MCSGVQWPPAVRVHPAETAPELAVPRVGREKVFTAQLATKAAFEISDTKHAVLLAGTRRPHIGFDHVVIISRGIDPAIDAPKALRILRLPTAAQRAHIRQPRPGDLPGNRL